MTSLELEPAPVADQRNAQLAKRARELLRSALIDLPAFGSALEHAQHLFDRGRVVAVAGAYGRARQLENQERVLYVLEGAVEGQADQRAFEAGAGSLVFVPEGAVWQWRSGRAGSTFFVIDGFAADPLPI